MTKCVPPDHGPQCCKRDAYPWDFIPTALIGGAFLVCFTLGAFIVMCHMVKHILEILK